MGVIADFTNITPAYWPTVLHQLRAANIDVVEDESDAGVRAFTCQRRRCRIGLACYPREQHLEAVVYCSGLHFWRRPVRMGRLLHDVRRVVSAPFQ